jgi:hypothetical protein
MINKVNPIAKMLADKKYQKQVVQTKHKKTKENDIIKTNQKEIKDGDEELLV